MAKAVPNSPPPEDPVVLPDVAIQPHPTAHSPEPPAVSPPDGEAGRPEAPSPLGDYVRELQQEYEEQEEEGKI